MTWKWIWYNIAIKIGIIFANRQSEQHGLAVRRFEIYSRCLKAKECNKLFNSYRSTRLFHKRLFMIFFTLKKKDTQIDAAIIAFSKCWVFWKTHIIRLIFFVSEKYRLYKWKSLRTFYVKFNMPVKSYIGNAYTCGWYFHVWTSNTLQMVPDMKSQAHIAFRYQLAFDCIHLEFSSADMFVSMWRYTVRRYSLIL